MANADWLRAWVPNTSIDRRIAKLVRLDRVLGSRTSLNVSYALYETKHTQYMYKYVYHFCQGHGKVLPHGTAGAIAA